LKNMMNFIALFTECSTRFVFFITIPEWKDDLSFTGSW